VTDTHSDGRIERGNQTRRLILARAVEIASAEGLEGLSIGRLAADLKISKSGVFALFGSKEEIQLATVRAATAVYLESVVNPAMRAAPGVERLWRLCQNWLAYSRDRVFPGGCFFFAAHAEFDTRPGRVRDLLADGDAAWTRLIEQTIEQAQRAGELSRDAEPRQLAFEIIALLETSNARSVLHDDPTAYDLAAVALLHRLRPLATDPSLLPAEPAHGGK
jgi:AcrR family transcriptional regulator